MSHPLTDFQRPSYTTVTHHVEQYSTTRLFSAVELENIYSEFDVLEQVELELRLSVRKQRGVPTQDEAKVEMTEKWMTHWVQRSIGIGAFRYTVWEKQESRWIEVRMSVWAFRDVTDAREREMLEGFSVRRKGRSVTFAKLANLRSAAWL